jgi:membrane protein implicated in regulation of membrane protease activity
MKDCGALDLPGEGRLDTPRPLVESIAGCAGTADGRSIRGVGDVSVIGCVGSLIVATRGAAGAGEVLLRVRGTKEAYLAWSEQPLPRGTEVLVIDVRSARTVVVEPWPGLSSQR